MTALDLSPAAGGAPRATRVLRHAAMEARLVARNGEQLLLALVIPIGLLIGGVITGARFGIEPEPFAASVLALGLWSTGFTALAVATGFERRYGVLERLAATPLTRGDLIAGKAVATASIALGQVVLLTVVALVLGWRPAPTAAGTAVALASAALAGVGCAGWALALAGRLRSEVVLGLANLIYLLVAAGGALVLPVAAYPDAVGPALRLLPSGALGEALRAWASGTVVWWPLPVLAAWCAVSLFVARKAFQWTS